MHSLDLFAAEATMANHTIAAQHSVRQRHLLRQTKVRRSGWASQRGGCFVHHLGQRLVVLGEWLEASGRPQPSF